MENSKATNGLKIYLDMLNQVFEIEKKAEKLQEPHTIGRNINRLKQIFAEIYQGEEAGFSYENPIGQKYDHTRIDCDASIAGESGDNLYIVEVIKPIIRYRKDTNTQIVQKAVVVASAKTEENPNN